MKPTRLILIPGLGSEPAPYLVVDHSGVRERGLLEPDSAEQPEAMRTVAIAPGAEVAVRWLDLPAGGAAQQRAAALWMLRESLATPVDRLEAALGPIAAPGEPRLVAVVGVALLQAWIDYLEALGVRADAIVPDSLTVPAPEDEDALNAVAFGPSVALRGRCFAASLQPDLVEFVAAGRRVDPIDDSGVVERSLIEAAISPPINLLVQDRIRGSARRGWALASLLAGALVVSPLVLAAAAAARDDLASARDARLARAELRRLAPDLAAVRDPVAALRQRRLASPPQGQVVAATAALFTAVESVEGAELDLLIVDPSDGMKASITHANYQDMQVISRAMRARGFEVTETGTVDDRGRIVSDITIGGGQ